MATRTSFLARVDAFLRATGMSSYRFGVEAVGDGKFVRRLRTGSSVTLRLIERAEAFIAAGLHENISGVCDKSRTVGGNVADGSVK